MIILILEYINIKIWILQREKYKKKIMGLFTLIAIWVQRSKVSCYS